MASVFVIGFDVADDDRRSELWDEICGLEDEYNCQVAHVLESQFIVVSEDRIDINSLFDSLRECLDGRQDDLLLIRLGRSRVRYFGRGIARELRCFQDVN